MFIYPKVILLELKLLCGCPRIFNLLLIYTSVAVITDAIWISGPVGKLDEMNHPVCTEQFVYHVGVCVCIFCITALLHLFVGKQFFQILIYDVHKRSIKHAPEIVQYIGKRFTHKGQMIRHPYIDVWYLFSSTLGCYYTMCVWVQMVMWGFSIYMSVKSQSDHIWHGHFKTHKDFSVFTIYHSAELNLVRTPKKKGPVLFSNEAQRMDF